MNLDNSLGMESEYVAGYRRYSDELLLDVAADFMDSNLYFKICGIMSPLVRHAEREAARKVLDERGVDWKDIYSNIRESKNEVCEIDRESIRNEWAYTKNFVKRCFYALGAALIGKD